jgi:ketosteroid isomerase-like protein
MSDGKTAVMRFYEAMGTGNPATIADTIHEDFSYEAPPMLPWGGITQGRDAVLAGVLPQLASAMDAASLRIESLVGEEDRVFVTVLAETAGGQPVRLCEDWTVRGDKPAAVRVYWFDPRPATPGGAVSAGDEVQA